MPLDDAILLERWITHRDAEAFNAIVERFADQVYGTCNRILRNETDAEDAAQECFLLLARAGGGVRSSLGGWLHGAATNLCRDRIRREIHRRARERVYSEAAPKTAEPTWDDIQVHVDAAIDALPEATRDVIVAHFLGRRTHAEIAADLRIGRRAVSYRIQGGLDSIRRDFARRGITLSAVAIGPLLAENVSAAPASLKASLGKLAIAAGTTGTVGGTAATTSMIGSLLIMKTKLAVFLIVISLIALGAYLSTPHPDNSAEVPSALSPSEMIAPLSVSDTARPQVAVEPTTSSQATETAASTPESLEDLLALSRSKLEQGAMGRDAIEDPAQYASVTGLVLDSNGYPIEGATVTLFPIVGWDMLPGAEGMTASTRSTPDGSYRIEGIARTGPYWVNAAKPGYVNGARGTLPATPVEIVPGMNAEGIDFALTQGITVYGRVLAADGRAVPHAFVHGIGITGLNSVAMFNRNGVQTDENGEFSLGFEEKNRGSVVALRVQSKAHGSSTFPDVPIEEGKTVELKMAGGAIIYGRVVDDNGNPIPDATLHFSGRKANAVEGGQPSLSGSFPAVCNYQGRYAVEVHSGLGFAVSVRAYGVDNSRQTDTIPIMAPGEVREHDVVLNINTLSVSGRLIGTPSGEAIVPRGGCRIQVYKDEIWQLEERGGGEFKFALPLEAGHYQFQARYEFNQHVSGPMSAVYELVAGQENQIEIAVPDPQYLSVRAVDANGNPVEGARLNVMTVTIENMATLESTNEDGRLDAPIVMPPYCGARIWLEKPGYAPAWGAIHEDQSPGIVHPEDVIVMVPSAGFEGDLVDAEGNPVANTALSIILTGAGGRSWPLNATTDAAGHFTIIDQAPSEVVDIRITTFREPTHAERVNRGQPPGMNIELPGADLVDVPEADTRVWAADQVALQADVITGLGSIARVE